MAVDLHLHSTFSDGTESPTAIVALATRAHLTGMALTDHDTLDGIAEGRAAAAAAGISFLAGTELSVEWRDRTMHMLVYFLEPGGGPLEDRMTALRDSRADRNRRIVECLQELGIDITLTEVTAESGEGVTGRPHFAAVLIRKGYATDIPDAFDRYLAAGRPAYVNRERLQAVEAIRLARASSAIPVIAHPHTLGVSAAGFHDVFEELTEVGLGGIEAYYGEYAPELREHLVDLCRQLGIVATGGSDFHGSYKPGLSVGVGKGDLRVPDRAFDDLIATRPVA